MNLNAGTGSSSIKLFNEVEKSSLFYTKVQRLREMLIGNIIAYNQDAMLRITNICL